MEIRCTRLAFVDITRLASRSHAGLDLRNPIGRACLADRRAGEVLRSRVHAASLNFPDLLIGAEQVPDQAAAAVRAGQRILRRRASRGRRRDVMSRWAMRWPRSASPAASRTQACASAASVLPLPAGFDLDDGAAFIFTYGTSHHALDRPRARCRPARRCWCWARPAASARAAVQIAKAAGARVIAAASTRREVPRSARELGADVEHRPVARRTCAKR